MTEHLGFTGTKAGMSEPQKRKVEELLRAIYPQVVHHGDCVGSDAEFHDIANSLGMRIHIHPPTEDKYRAFKAGQVVYERKPYLKRDQDIVDLSEILIATPLQSTMIRRSGTWATVRRAQLKQIRVIVVRPDGTHYDA